MANINVIIKTVAAAATPEVLGTDKQRFQGVVFFGGKGSAETNNSGTSYVQLQQMNSNGTVDNTWTSAMPVPAGQYSAGLNLDTTSKQSFGADQFRIKVSQNGDGVVAIVAT